jgi:hypothetical protein
MHTGTAAVEASGVKAAMQHTFVLTLQGLVPQVT